MKTWTKDIEINAPIEKVWQYLDGSFEDMQKIMPQVVGNQPVKITVERSEVCTASNTKKEKEFRNMM